MLSRHGSNLARPVIIHDIIHGLIYVPSTPFCGFFGETAPTSIGVLLRPTQGQSDEPSDLLGSLTTSVIEHKPLSERFIPYTLYMTTPS